MNDKIAVIGLGYVGLPLAVAFARKFPGVVGFDVNRKKIDELRQGIDHTGEVDSQALRETTLRCSADPEDLRACNFFIVAVPTPIDHARRPDLSLMVKASETVARVMPKGAVVVYESTVYPGVTEEVCGPVLERVSGLKAGVDFKLGYSPERINPGDKEHTLERIVKVVAGEDAQTLEQVAAVYGRVIEAGVYRAQSIKVAEAAKVIENTQRDLNIALMNELAIIFDKLGIRSADVLAAAGTKWNFLPFRPGLVGGHCIGVDPYYLTHKAEELGYHPQVILAGRRINDGMGAYVAAQTVKLLSRARRLQHGARVGVLGLTFKENVPDIRNSRVPDIIAELQSYGLDLCVHDPLADAEETRHEYGLDLCGADQLADLDAVILAVPHKAFLDQGPAALVARLKNGQGPLLDVKSAFTPGDFGAGVAYWSL